MECVALAAAYVAALALLMLHLYRDDIASKRWEKATRVQWHVVFREVHYEPIVVRFVHDVMPQRAPATLLQMAHGLLGLADHQIVFQENRSEDFYLRLSLDAIRWFGKRATTRYGERLQFTYDLFIYYVVDDFWRIATLVPDKPEDLDPLIEALDRLLPLKPQFVDRGRESFGPYPALRVEQSIYGYWQPVVDQGSEISAELIGSLFFAPDRLLYNFRDGILLAQIQRVEGIQEGSFQQQTTSDHELLRIEYDAAGQTQTANFLVGSAKLWAVMFRSRTNIPVEMYEGRKKKPQ